jgi:two-component system chemotaxis response regulator CheB
MPADAAPALSRPDAIRVMVVDDSVVVRGLVARWLEEDKDIVVVGTPRNGKIAVESVARLDPDVIILDVEMPEMDGLEALPLLLRAKPGIAVIMASTLTRRNAEISLKAIQLGARDYVPKPEGNAGVTTSTDFRREIVEKVKALGNRQRNRRPVAAPVTGAAPATARLAAASPSSRPAAVSDAAGRMVLRPFSTVVPRILAIGSSTGGPQALMDMLKACPSIFARVPVVITQHMPPTFTAILAEHISKAVGIDAQEAREGEPLRANRIYVAPGGLHMVLARGAETVIRLLDTPPVNFCRPAVDPLFESVAAIYGPATLAVVLTGMGHDGARGAGHIANAGGTVIAQDEATSVVWGMPGATAQSGVAAAVLPLPSIAPKIVQLVTGVR